MPRQYISVVQLPTKGIYYIKDEEARQAIQQLSNFSKYIGVTSTIPTTAETLVEYQEYNPNTGETDDKYILYCLNPDKPAPHTGDIDDPYQELLESGNVVTVIDPTATPPYNQDEYIFNGTGWAKLSTVTPGTLGQFAYVDTGHADVPAYDRSGTLTVNSTSLDATSLPVTLTSTSLSGATSIITAITSNGITYVSGIDSSNTTFTGESDQQISVAGTATQSSVAIELTYDSSAAATLVKNSSSITWSLSSVESGGIEVVTAIPTSAVTTGSSAIEINTTAIYGASESISPLLTAEISPSTTSVLEATSSTTANVFTATVASNTEVLVLNAIDTVFYSTNALNTSTIVATTAASAFTATSAVTKVSKVTVTIGDPTKTGYVVTVPSNTLVEGVTYDKTTSGYADIEAEVNASGLFTPSGTISVSVNTANASVITDITTSYGQVNAYAGGSHTHEVTDNITIVASGTTSVSVNPDIPTP